MRIRRHSLSFCAALLLVTFAESATAQIRTVLVSPVPGNPVASGTALRNALAAISSPSATNPWLVKIEPGIFDVGTTSLQMRSWVDIAGSGIGVTTIRGSVDGESLTAGTINGASNAELRLLTVHATGSGAPNAIAMYNEIVSSLRIYRVRFIAQSSSAGGSAWGMRNAFSTPSVEESEFAVSATTWAFGLVFQEYVVSQRTAILRCRIGVSGATTNYGILMGSGQTVTEIRDTRMDVTGGSTTYGLYAIGSGWQGSESLTIRNTEINSAGGSTASYGVRLELGANIALDVSSSKIWGHVAPTTYGVLHGNNSPMGFQSSSIIGFTNTVSTAGNVSIASTLLHGGPVTAAGWKGCMGVWDEGGVFYSNTCPP
jgi:hypothetical protein